MSLRTTRWPAGMPCWTDLTTPDVDGAKAFYGAVLGWTFDSPGPDDGSYVMAQVDGTDVAGIGHLEPGGQIAWLLHIATDDVDATAGAVTANGGSVIVPVRAVGPLGRMCVVTDPTGAPFAAWEAGQHIGAGRVNEPGAISWEDLRSPDPSTAQAFYRAVFGYETNLVEMAGADYVTFHLPGEGAPLGGMGPMMGSAEPAHWDVYFAVGNCDEAVVAASAAGGSVGAPAFDSPFGRMATLVDPAGASFIVFQQASGQPGPERGD